ncbi:MAG: alpha/beta hydrolase [Ferruginibacter sp.]
MKIQQKIAIGFFRTKINLLKLINNRKAAEEAFRLFCTPMMKASIKQKEVFKRAEPLQFELNGQLVKGYRCNHPSVNKILLLHGFSSSCHNFDKYVEPLIQKNYEVLAFDAPAHGSSEGTIVNAIQYGEMIRKINNLYGPINGYVAHSFGGIALCLALETMTHDQDTKIVLIAPATETTTAIDNAFGMLGLKDKILRKLVDEIVFEKGGKETAWYSARRALKNISATVLWFHDEDDDITPLADALKVRSDNHSNVNFVITSKLGHRKIYRDESVVSAVVKFL